MELTKELKQKIDDYFQEKSPEEIYQILKKYGFKDTKKLCTFRKYADMKGVTTMCVYKWEKQGKITTTEIDGVKFVELSEEEMEQMKKLKDK